MRVEGGPIAEENGVFYLLRDHLGSANVTVKEDSGALAKYAELRYKPWGEDRPASDAFNETLSPSERRFTSQRAHDELGLYDYQARWYDPALGLFVQPDSIVPESQGVQAWDRYAYANNSPVRYTDPTGHWLNEGYGQCEFGEEKTPQPTDPLKSSYDFTLGGNTKQTEVKPESNTENVNLKSSHLLYITSENNQDIKQAILGAGLILVTDLFVGLPCAYVIGVSGRVSPPALAAEALEVFVVLPVNLMGIYLIYDAFQE